MSANAARVTRVRFALFTLPVLLLAACGGPAVPPAQNYPTIHGRAYDVASNAPVAGVLISVDTILTASTGSDGTYRIPNVPVGTYSFRVTPPQGYSAPDQPGYNGSVAAGENVTIDVPLTHL
jgi:hypothetical protein